MTRIKSISAKVALMSALLGGLILFGVTSSAFANTTTQTKSSADSSDIQDIDAEVVTADEFAGSSTTTTQTRQSRIQELNHEQSEAIIKAYEDDPEQFIIVEEEVIEEDGDETERAVEIVKEINYQNFKIELATVGEGKKIGDAELTEESKERLDRVAILLNSNPNDWKAASIHGYSNLYDSPRSNMEISHRRAFMAHHYLSGKGVDQNKVTLRAFSRKKPQGDNANLISRNNRIIILYVNNVLDGTFLAQELRKLEEQPIGITIIQPLATKTNIIYKDRVVYKEAKPKIIYKQVKPRVFKIEIAGVGSNFKTADSALNEGSRRRLKRLAILLDLHKGQWKDIEVHGHTDERGGYNYNMNLSSLRANSVLSMLKSEGVSSDRISAKAFGYTKPLVNRSNLYAWQKNRRVEILISGVNKDSALAKALRTLVIPTKQAAL